MTGLIATFFYAGYLKPAPGTWGSLAGLVAAWVLVTLGGVYLLGLAVIAVFALGLWAVRIETAGIEDKDPSEIVIDEVVGIWIALLPTALGASLAGFPLLALWPGLVTSFLFFRLFDIWKPGLVGRADRRGDAMGVMLDDVWAGVFAAVSTGLLAAVAHLAMRFL